ncbi:rCG22910 [Rattus norvegicus]|uniref:RCG22910 n=1 Tax=Rattus norvegicus TaxID=10116 RepID=A6KPC8_RAT|nr:rCG22910 [Rattus norvegicus]
MYFMHVNKGMTCSCSMENGNWKSHPAVFQNRASNIL